MVITHPDCGEPVIVVDGELYDVGGAEHLCRDYVAWYLPADRRHPDDIPSWCDATPRRRACWGETRVAA